MATDSLLGEKNAISNRLDGSLIGVAQDLRRRLITEALTGVFKDSADLRSADGVNDRVAVLTSDIARAESDDNRRDLPFEAPVLAQRTLRPRLVGRRLDYL